MSKRAVVACLVMSALAGVAQLALLVAGGGDVRALPLVPLAGLAGWAAARGPLEAWVGLLPAPLLLGLASDERAGWFVLALAPTPLLAAAVRGRPGTARAFGAAAAAAALGVLAYTALLAGVGGDARALLEDPGAIGRGALLTGLLAVCCATALLPFRPRERGLFG